MSAMLDAFKIKPFDLEPVLAEWTDGPVFKGKPKKDPPVEEWLEQIKAGCVQRNIPEEYWYKVAQHFMGKRARARFEEVKKVVATVNGGKYRWTWKKFKVAMANMGWDIDPNATETVKIRGSAIGNWFGRKKSNERSSTVDCVASTSASTETTRPPPPKRSGTLKRWTTKAMVEEPLGDEPFEMIETPGVAASRPKPSRSKTLNVTESSFWSRKDSKNDAKDEKPLPERPSHPKAKSEMVLSKSQEVTKSKTEVSRSHTTDEQGGEVAQAPVWLLNAVTALDFLTAEHPKAVSVLSAILITVGSIPAIPAISAGAGGAILASGAAHAIGAVAVGLGQALGAAAVKNHQQEGSSSSSR